MNPEPNQTPPLSVAKSPSNWSTPTAIVIAGLVIAGAVYFGDSRSTSDQTANLNGFGQTDSLSRIRKISTTDHIRGNPEASVIIVEYSDTECPFCVRFHQTMKQIIDTYGKAGQVAWVYRHFPLDQLHPKARREAVALECANELGGNDKFWEYTDRIYQTTPANNGLDPAELPKIAVFVGLDQAQFSACLASGRYDAKVEADVKNAQLTGGTGTPWSIMILKSALTKSQQQTIADYVSQNGLRENVFISPDKTKIALSGALPLEMIKKIIDSVI